MLLLKKFGARFRLLMSSCTFCVEEKSDEAVPTCVVLLNKRFELTMRECCWADVWRLFFQEQKST
eukprot:3365164-Amphidinium_carterae.1